MKSYIDRGTILNCLCSEISPICFCSRHYALNSCFPRRDTYKCGRIILVVEILLETETRQSWSQCYSITWKQNISKIFSDANIKSLAQIMVWERNRTKSCVASRNKLITYLQVVNVWHCMTFAFWLLLRTTHDLQYWDTLSSWGDLRYGLVNRHHEWLLRVLWVLLLSLTQTPIVFLK